MMTNIEALNFAEKKFKTKKITSADLDAEVLLQFALNKPKEFLYAHPEIELTQAQLKKFKKLLKRRLKLEPIAYITGHKEFYGLDFFVNKNVLIPRPETELIIDEVIEAAKKLPATSYQLTIADVGTGSGCVAIALAKLLPTLFPSPQRGRGLGEGVNIYAVDISKKALNVAQKNARQNGVKINFLKGNLLEPAKKINPKIIAANLPYLDKKTAQCPGLKFEPKTALLAGEDGLKFYKKLFQQIKKFNLAPKLIICEIGPEQTKKIKKITKHFIPKYKVKIIKDFSGKNRLIKCEKKPLSP